MKNAEQECKDMIARFNPFKSHVIKEKHNDGLYRHWRCGKPDSSVYHFNVITWPGWVAVTGDIGELMVSRVQDMLTFVRGSIHSTSYFAEKVPRCIPTKEFSSDKAWQVIREKIDEITETLNPVDCEECEGRGEIKIEADAALGITASVEKCEGCNGTGEIVAPDLDEEEQTEARKRIEELERLQREVSSGELSEGELHREWYDLLDGDYEVNFRDWNSNFLWCREALIWFINTYDKQEADRAKAESNPTPAQEGLADATQHGEGGSNNEVGQPVSIEQGTPEGTTTVADPAGGEPVQTGSSEQGQDNLPGTSDPSVLVVDTGASGTDVSPA